MIFQSEKQNEKFAYINPLPYVLSLTTAKMSDGRIAILSLSSENYDSVNILFKSKEHYADISEMYFDTYAIITDLKGNTGVIDYQGNIVVKPEYEKVVAKLVDSEESRFLGAIVEFTCYKYDGTQCVFIKKW